MFLRFVARCALLLVPILAARGQGIADSLFDRATRVELERVIASARQAGLPTAPLVNRALQGAARGVSGTRVVEIVRSYADSMQVALALLGPQATAAEVDAGAAALRAGVGREEVRRIRRSREPGQATTALVVLTDLVRRGVSSRDATDAVTAVAAAQGDDALLTLQRELARDGGAPTAERLRTTVQQLRRRPDTSQALDRALDGRSLPMLARRLVAVSGRGTASTLPVLEGVQALTLGMGLGLSLAARTDGDPGDSLTTHGRAAVTWSARMGPSLAAATWLGVASRPLRLAGESRSSRDTSGTGAEALSATRLSGATWLAGLSVSRAIGRRLAVGALAELQGDDVLRRRMEPVWQQPVADTIPTTPDTAILIGMREAWHPTSRYTLHTALTAALRSLTLQASMTTPFATSRDSIDLARVFALSAEQRLAPRISVFALVTSQPRSGVLPSAMPSDSRLRVGMRWTERRPTLSTPAPERASTSALSVTVTPTDWHADSGATLRVEVTAPSAHAVWVEGDATQWRPVLLVRTASGVFASTFRVTGALVRLRVKLDGGRWMVPPGFAVDVDEFGEAVGVMVVR